MKLTPGSSLFLTSLAAMSIAAPLSPGLPPGSPQVPSVPRLIELRTTNEVAGIGAHSYAVRQEEGLGVPSLDLNPFHQIGDITLEIPTKGDDDDADADFPSESLHIDTVTPLAPQISSTNDLPVPVEDSPLSALPDQSANDFPPVLEVPNDELPVPLPDNSMKRRALFDQRRKWMFAGQPPIHIADLPAIPAAAHFLDGNRFPAKLEIKRPQRKVPIRLKNLPSINLAAP